MKTRRRSLNPSVYDLLEIFVDARAAFFEVYDAYESRVLAHARERGVDRLHLRLSADEVSKLLDLARLESLRNGPCHDLKEIAHALFRRKASTDKLDRYASEIFHELSILKEEQYKVSTFAPEYHKRNELDEYESILDEVHEEFPRKVHNLRELFERARKRLEAILRRHAKDTVLLRSLLLFGDELLKKARNAYPRGVRDLAWAVYPQGPLELFVATGRSFAASGFKAQAVRALEAAVAEDGAPPDGKAHAPEAELRALKDEARALLARWRELSPRELVKEAAHVTRDPTAAPLAPANLDADAAPASGDDLLDDEPFVPEAESSVSGRRRKRTAPSSTGEVDG